MLRLLSLFAVAAYSLSAFAQAWIPDESSAGELVQHFAHTLSYNEDHEQPNWVGHVLRREHLRNCVGRDSNFRVDPRVSTGSASPSDYLNSGYDRGHLVPAGDMKWSSRAMRDTFYMSNVSPQSPQLNQGRWAALENLVRAWARQGDETIVIAGPILEENLPRIGANNVSVPRRYFKAILRNRGGDYHAIGFLFTQTPGNQALPAYALSIRKLEELTGLDLFPHLPAATQEMIEADIAWDQWDFNARASYDPCGSER